MATYTENYGKEGHTMEFRIAQYKDLSVDCPVSREIRSRFAEIGTITAYDKARLFFNHFDPENPIFPEMHKTSKVVMQILPGNATKLLISNYFFLFLIDDYPSLIHLSTKVSWKWPLEAS